MGRRRWLLRASFLALLLLSLTSRAHAASNKLKVLRDGSVDLMMTVDWDFDAPDAPADRAHIEQSLREFAASTYRATEGRLSICRVYVYDEGAKTADADIVLSQRADRAYAFVGGLRDQRGNISAFLRSKQQGGAVVERTAKQLGQTLAHEFGHYGLYVLDEYYEPKAEGAPVQEFDSPRECDVRLGTLMGSKAEDIFSFPNIYTDRKYLPWRPRGDFRRSTTDPREKYSSCEGLVPVSQAAEGEYETAMWRTSHWRYYQRSAWEVIAGPPVRARPPAKPVDLPGAAQFPAVRMGGVPAAPTQPAYDGACFQAVFLEGAFIALAIDRSTSMLARDGPNTETYFDLARKSAKSFVETIPAGVTVTLVEFSSESAVVMPPLRLDAASLAQGRAQIAAAIDALPPPVSAATGIERALDLMFDLFIENAAVGNRQYVLAFTDGEISARTERLDKFLSGSIPIFGKIVGTKPNADVLGVITRHTRGETRRGDWTYGLIQELLEKDRQLGIRTFPRPRAQEPLEVPVELSELDGDATFRAEWGDGDHAVFELVAPDGAIISEDALPPRVRFERELTSATFHFDAPPVGAYRARLIPQGTPMRDMHVTARARSPLELTVDVTGGARFPDPHFLEAKLTATAPVVGAEVLASVVRSAGTRTATLTVRLLDDGRGSDRVAADGVYSAPLAQLTEDGSYAVEVVATNPGGAAVDSAAVGEGDGEGGSLVPLSAFTRRERVTLAVTGYRPMPQTREGALEVRNDLTPIWVTLEAPGDTVWLTFNGYANGRYAAMTGALIANDAQAMKTKLTLYDVDGTTVLGTDAAEDGRAWVELTTGPADGKYALKVEHAERGVGRLQVAVAPREWLETAGTDGDSGAGGLSCGCATSGADGVAGALALVLLSALVRRRRRACVDADRGAAPADSAAGRG